MSDPSLFDTVETHARLTDPVSSELTLKSLGKDTTLNWRIFDCVVRLSGALDESSKLTPVSDDDILSEMEMRYARRFQRNVVARQRGIIRELGWIERAPDVRSWITGRMTIAHVPTAAGLAAWKASR